MGDTMISYRTSSEIRKEREEHNCLTKHCKIIVMSNDCNQCGERIPPHGNPQCMCGWYVCGNCIGDYCKRIDRSPENEGAIEGKVVWINGRV